MKTLKIATVILLVISWTIQNPAQAQAPIHQAIHINNEVFALHQPKEYAYKVIKAKGWSAQQYECVVNLWTQESHWNYKSRNPHSTAYGIGQLLIETSRKPDVQIRNGLRYIEYRYGTPCSAWKWWRSHYWY